MLKTLGTQLTEYVYDDDGQLIGEYLSEGEGTEVLWLGDVPVAVLKPAGSTQNGMSAGAVKVYFIQPDHLDTPRVIVNAANQAVWRWDSAPFGDTAANAQPTARLAAFGFNPRFPGQQFDAETGTHYNYFRDYEPGVGEYVQSDPIGLPGGLETYGYTVHSKFTQIGEVMGIFSGRFLQNKLAIRA